MRNPPSNETWSPRILFRLEMNAQSPRVIRYLRIIWKAAVFVRGSIPAESCKQAAEQRP